MKSWRLCAVALAGLLALSGCVEPPKYSSTPTAIGSAIKTSAYREVRLGVVTTENYRLAMQHVTEWEDLARRWGAMGSIPSKRMFNSELTALLNSRFKQVVELDRSDQARERGVDMLMVLDTKINIGSVSFQQTTVEIIGIFQDEAGSVFDSIPAKGAATIPWPNTGPQFDGALAQALDQFGTAIDGSAKLIAAAEPITNRARQLAAQAQQPAVAVAMTPAAPEPPRPSRQFAFPAGKAQNPEAVAIIVGNRDYQHRDVPMVRYALNDAEAMRQYLVSVQGFSPRNVVVLQNAKQSELLATFGAKGNEKGRLYDMVRPGRSDIFVFYSGHGVPGDNGSGYLLPADADPGKPALTGYAVDTLVENLGRVRARSVTVAIDSCFSGLSDGGALVQNASPVYIAAETPRNMTGGVLLTAADGRQIASWDKDSQMGLFTRYLLEGMLGKADDKNAGGNGDGMVSAAELRAYLASEVTYQARRAYGRDQTPQVAGDLNRPLAPVPAGKFAGF